MPPLLSLIVPYRRAGHALPRLLASIHAQSFRDLEVIIVDDASNDNVLAIVEEWRQKGICIELIRQIKRTFTLQCRLDGMRLAHGEIIGFADADDMLWGDEALEQNVEIFLRQHADVLHFRSVVTDRDGNFYQYAHLADPFGSIIKGTVNILERYCHTDFYGHCSLWNKFFSNRICRVALDEIYDERFKLRREDAWLLLHLLIRSQSYIGTDFVGYGYVWAEKRHTLNPEKAIAHYNFYRAGPELLRRAGIPAHIVAAFRRSLEETLCGDVGHMCRAWRKLPAAVWQQRITSLRERADCGELVEMLLVANGINAERLVNIFKIFRT